jgi:ubiquitin carboxyl-terminal hydrolase 36/42
MNLGNTCFLNSVLQCLTYIPPLANFLLGGEHGSTCTRVSFCVMCEMEKHVRRCLGTRSVGGGISPTTIVGHLRLIAKHMRLGRQEDAHEFLRFLLDGAQRAESRGDRTITSIFGGHLRSEIKCGACGKRFKANDPFMDISLDIRHPSASSVPRALEHFVAAERLTGDNRYRCEGGAVGGCGELSEAEKRMLIGRPPAVLTLHLKRFQVSPASAGFHGHGGYPGGALSRPGPLGGATGKINREVKFEASLDIGPYVKKSVRNKGQRLRYTLCGVLVHDGHTCDSGHYHAFVRASSGVWYAMDDASVRQVSLHTVLSQKAYLLFYTLL